MLDKISETLHDNLLQNGVIANISSRLKNPHSILEKMEKKCQKIEDLSDVIAFRIIVSTKDECYQTLYIINNMYQVITKKFKDFILEPKENGYQSLHTVIILDIYNRKIEVQIRTWDMHHEAEKGKASHYRYKPYQHTQEFQNNIASNIILQKAYEILDKFKGTNLELRAYEQEIKNIWHSHNLMPKFNFGKNQ